MTSKPQPALTPDQSRAARRELAMSQKDVIEQTGVQAYKIKQFEGRHMPIEAADQRKLREFYEAHGVDFDAIDAHLHQGVPGDAAPPNSLKPGLTSNPRPGFFISSDLPSTVVDKLMEDMEASDDRIAELVKTSVKSGLMGGMTDQTESDIRELFGHLAANHLRFRCLQGRNIIAPTRDEAKTVGDHLAAWAQDKSLVHVIPDVDAASALGQAARQAGEQE